MPLNTHTQPSSEIEKHILSFLSAFNNHNEPIEYSHIDKDVKLSKKLQKELNLLKKIAYPINAIKKRKYNLQEQIWRYPYPNPYQSITYNPKNKYWLVGTKSMTDQFTDEFVTRSFKIKISIAKSNSAYNLSQKYDYVFPYPLDRIAETSVNQILQNFSKNKIQHVLDISHEIYIPQDKLDQFITNPVYLKEFIQSSTVEPDDHPLTYKDILEYNYYHTVQFASLINTFTKLIKCSSEVSPKTPM